MDKSRFSLVLSIVRRFTNDYHTTRYDADELTSEIYIYVDDLIKSNPFIENDDLIKLGIEKCRKLVKPHNASITYQDWMVAKKVNTEFVETDHKKLLHLWCENRSKRQGKKWQSRIMAYLHFVEGLTVSDLANTFGKSLQAMRATLHQVHSPRVKNMLKKNDIVLLVMNNPFFNHMLAWVTEPTEWGAMVEVESHCYPHRKRWQLRATTDEMVYIGTLASLPETPKIPESVDGSKTVLSNAQAMLKAEHIYTAEERAQLERILDEEKAILNNGPVKEFKPKHPISDPQFTGDECSACGKMMMVRAGTCLTCLSCGTTTGC